MFTLKKSLGQHFLKDENIIRKIVEELKKITFQNLLEVGPGGGALTKYLMDLPSVNFIAVEIDEEKVHFLRNTYPALKEKILHQNFLGMIAPFKENFMVVGNFPYNLSTQILFKVLEWNSQVDGVIGMFQKEVALRIAAKEGNKIYGVTSVLIQAWYDVTYLFDVQESSFAPPPKVKSGVIRLERRTNNIEMRSVESFFNLVKTAFGQRRKTLRNACKNLFEAATLQKKIFDLRAEQLTIEQFAQLTFEMK